MPCKICKAEINLIFRIKILKKYQVSYYKCDNCKFIQTEEPFWLDEAYNDAITELDIGLTGRNIYYSGIIDRIIRKGFDVNKKFLDYGGGYGMFVRIMRDKGYNFFRYDTYCQNIFAKNFDFTDLPNNQNFEILTAFEVFEHLVDPISEVEKMLSFSNNILFTTELQPNENVNPQNWWYFVPETGQHVSLYSKESIKHIANHFNLHYTNNGSLHLLSKKNNLNLNVFLKLSLKDRLMKRIRFLADKKQNRPKSLLAKDFAYIKKKINL